MAKGDPNSVTVQYKVHLKPTEIGRLVIQRLARPHLDVSPELRRFIELGYACEQAGFILDGTILRHAGRAWDTQPALTAERSIQEVAKPDRAPQLRPRANSKPAQNGEPAAPLDGTAPWPAAVSPKLTAEDGSQNKGSLRNRLRGLST
jgi:hypothetical protein